MKMKLRKKKKKKKKINESYPGKKSKIRKTGYLTEFVREVKKENQLRLDQYLQ
jgi:hypothetical protein